MRPRYFSGSSITEASLQPPHHTTTRWRSKYITDKMDLINLSENVRMTKNLCARTSGVIEVGSDIEY